VHVNGFTDAGAERRVWFARRSATKPIDPGRFDTLVGGGIAERDSVTDSLLREAREEAGIEATLARTAIAWGQVGVEHHASDGLQRETIFVYDLGLPQTFAPANQDGEVSGYRLLGVDEAAELIACSEGDDTTTLDACVVTLDHLIRHGTWALTDDTRAELATLCRRLPD
jgi:8-oxo-dGTP pyrophosphatase MutT (NUDIX family)